MDRSDRKGKKQNIHPSLNGHTHWNIDISY